MNSKGQSTAAAEKNFFGLPGHKAHPDVEESAAIDNSVSVAGECYAQPNIHSAIKHVAHSADPCSILD